MSDSKTNSDKTASRSSTVSEANLPDDERLSFAEIRKSEHQVLEHGMEAARILGSTVYNLAYQRAIKEVQDQWMFTEPHEVKKREALYFEIQAMSRVQHNLNAMLREAVALDQDRLDRETANQQETDEFLTFQNLASGNNPDPG